MAQEELQKILELSRQQEYRVSSGSSQISKLFDQQFLPIIDKISNGNQFKEISKEDSTRFTTTLKILRNLCVSVQNNQQTLCKLLINTHLSKIQVFLLNISEIVDSSLGMESISFYIQMFGNMITANQQTQSLFWNLYWPSQFRLLFDWILLRYSKIQSTEETEQINSLDTLVRSTIALIYNCVCNDSERMKQILEERKLFGSVLEILSQHNRLHKLKIIPAQTTGAANLSTSSQPTIQEDEVFEWIFRLWSRILKQMGIYNTFSSVLVLSNISEDTIQNTSTTQSIDVRVLTYLQLLEALITENVETPKNQPKDDIVENYLFSSDESERKELCLFARNLIDIWKKAYYETLQTLFIPTTSPNENNNNNNNDSSTNSFQNSSSLFSVGLLLLSHFTALEQFSTQLPWNHNGFLDVVVEILEKATQIEQRWREENKEKTKKDEFSFEFKVDLVRIIGNLAFRNRSCQDRVRELNAIPLMLQQCNLDFKNPFLREWALFAVRNLCEQNSENQAVIASMKLQSVRGDDADLRALGLEVVLENGKINVKQRKRE